MKTVTTTVEGVLWNLHALHKIHGTKAKLVVDHMTDAGTYPKLPPERKQAALELLGDQMEKEYGKYVDFEETKTEPAGSGKAKGK